MLRTTSLLACLILGFGCTDRSNRDSYEPDNTAPSAGDPGENAQRPDPNNVRRDTVDQSSGLSVDKDQAENTRSPMTGDRIDQANADNTGVVPPSGEPGSETEPGTGEVTTPPDQQPSKPTSGNRAPVSATPTATGSTSDTGTGMITAALRSIESRIHRPRS